MPRSVILGILSAVLLLPRLVIADENPVLWGRDKQWWIDERTWVVLARIEKVTPIEKPNVGGQMENAGTGCTVTILVDFRGRHPSKTSVTVSGKGVGQGQSADRAVLPNYQIGATVLMVLRTTGGERDFDYAGRFKLPIGLVAPCEVDAREVDSIGAALLALGDVVRDHRVQLDRDRALELIREPNYYVWALGVSALASVGTPADRDIILKCFAGDGLTPKMVLWLDEVLGSILPENVRPPVAERHALLLDYVRRKASNPPGESGGRRR